MGTLRLLNSVKATMDKTKEEGNAAKVSTLPRSKKSPLMFVEAKVNGRASRALLDTGATHHFVAEREATRLGLRYTKEKGTLKTVNTSPTPIHGVARGVPIRLGEWRGTIDLTVVTMDDFALVLGIEFMDAVRPWTFEKDGTMTISKDQEACSIPIDREVVEAKMLSAIQLKKGVQKGQATFLATLVEEESHGTEVPNEVSEILKEFEDVMPPELPKRLPPRREVYHKIELEQGARPPLQPWHLTGWPLQS